MPVLGLVLRPDQEAHEEQVDDNVCWERAICHIHVGRDGCYEVCQHCTARTADLLIGQSYDRPALHATCWRPHSIWTNPS